MNDTERIELTKKVANVVGDLLLSIDKAGGQIEINSLLNMTMLEFIGHVAAPNGITFKVRVEEKTEKFPTFQIGQKVKCINRVTYFASEFYKDKVYTVDINNVKIINQLVFYFEGYTKPLQG